jgi:RNA-directed DNA polymerase
VSEWQSVKSFARALGLDAELLIQLAGGPAVHYKPFILKRGTKQRMIDNPDRALKYVQRHIRKRLLRVLDLPDHVHGCVRGRSPLSNAAVHNGQPNVASIDIKDFYPSVSAQTIFMLWRSLGFGVKVADLLTKLTTFDGHLPQGAPTSDALANHTLARVDAQLRLIANALGLAVSRYLDNIDLSGVRTREAIPLVINAIRDEGFAVRHKKTFNRGPRSSHVVTGYTVNNRHVPSVCRKEQRRIRFAVHEMVRANEKGRASIAMARALYGRLLHLRRTNAGAAAGLDQQLVDAGVDLRRLAFTPTHPRHRKAARSIIVAATVKTAFV